MKMASCPGNRLEDGHGCLVETANLVQILCPSNKCRKISLVCDLGRCFAQTWFSPSNLVLDIRWICHLEHSQLVLDGQRKGVVTNTLPDPFVVVSQPLQSWANESSLPGLGRIYSHE